MGIRAKLRTNYYLFSIYYSFRYRIPEALFGKRRDIRISKKKFKKYFGRKINLKNPQTLNEKIQWLKINVREDFQTVCADKYKAREYWSKFGTDGLVPLLFQTYDWKDITLEVIPDEPCIIKANNGSGEYFIVRDKKQIDINYIRKMCRIWLSRNYYLQEQEWQYKNIKPCIIIEKLLLDKNGKIPNDYKFNFINGELQFIYCSIDREGENYRAIYSPEWKRMDFEWVAKSDHKGALVGKGIETPKNYEKMIAIAKEIAKNFCYVRVDFYEVEGKLYYGEITLHHGSGYDTFEPEKYDYIYGGKMVLPLKIK